MRLFVFVLLLVCSWMAFAVINMTDVKMYATTPTGHGDLIGTIGFIESDKGLLIQLNLANLAPGPHGFHIHEIPACDDNGEAAGPHYDPDMTKKHLGPNGAGHRGDLPEIVVNKEGMATDALLAPRLSLADLKGHAVVIHEFGDNYSDTPKMNGGGGPRVACGIVPDDASPSP